MTWDDITVPGNWQLQGYDKPIYVNVSTFRRRIIPCAAR